MTKLKFFAAAGLAISMTAANAGVTILIDPDGGGSAGPISVSSLGWNNGNAIAVADQGKLTDLLSPGLNFNTYGHAALANFLDPDGNTVPSTGLNDRYEWTYVFGFGETVQSITGSANNVANFLTLGSVAGRPNFFQIWYGSIDSNNLTGRNFQNGTMILEGTLAANQPSDFTNNGCTVSTAGALACSPLDGFNTNNYQNIQSVNGIGSADFTIDVTFTDPAFFLNGLKVLSLNYDAFQNLPYNQQNPSSCFWNGSAYISGAGPFTGASGTGCETNTVGTINGLDGTNVMFMTRSTNDFTAVPVPAPHVSALLGIGLLGLAFGVRRKSPASA